MRSPLESGVLVIRSFAGLAVCRFMQRGAGDQDSLSLLPELMVLS